MEYDKEIKRKMIKLDKEKIIKSYCEDNIWLKVFIEYGI